MSNIGAQLRMHYINSKKSYIIFWTIMMMVSALGIIIALYLRTRGYDGELTTNNITATVIFCAISSAVAYHETFPYTLNMGCTRKDFTIGFMVYNIALAFSLAFIFNIYIIIEYLLYKILGFNVNFYGYTANSVHLQGFHEIVARGFGLPHIWSNIMLHGAFLMAIAGLFTLLFSINYLKGKMYLFGLGGLVIVLMFLPKIRDGVIRALMYIYFTFIGKFGAFKLTLYSLIFFILCYILIYPITRVTQVKR